MATGEALATGARRAVPVTVSRLRPGWLVGAVTLLVVALLVAVFVGPADLGVGAILAELVDKIPGLHVDSGLSASQQAILWQIRLPRVILGALVGAALAGSGAAYQGVFRNPLADPYLLGVAAGAGLGATVVIGYAPGLRGLLGGLAIPVLAFGGAIVSVVLTYWVGRSLGGRSSGTLILAGVAVASFLTALQTFVMQSQSDTIREVYGFILGRLSTAGWGEVLLAAPYVTLSLAVILLHRRLLDVMAVGDAEAAALGIEPGRVRAVVVVAATLGTAAAVSVSGLIGFVGIIVPHVVRLFVGSSHRVVLPLSILGGGAFLALTDVLARSLLSPAELPIGVVTAFFGAPFFALVLRSSRRSIG